MIDQITHALTQHLPLSPSMAVIGSYTVLVLGVIMLAFIVDLIMKKVLLRVAVRISRHTKTTVDDIFISNRVPDRLAHLVPAIILYLSGELLFSDIRVLTLVFQRVALAYITFYVALTFTGLVDSLTDFSRSCAITKDKPIKSYAQVINLLVYLVTGILIISIIIDRSPFVLLSGLGAMTAILLLVFKDSILGFVASIQISAYDMVHVGDWISFPKYGTDGDVLDISLNVITIQNWDKTLTMVPTYAFISDSFQNWRGMSLSGGRRIKRALSIDMRTVRLLDDDLLERLAHVDLLKKYLEKCQKIIQNENREKATDSSLPINSRHLTNLGIFRKYIDEYLRNNPKINQQMTLLVRQLPPTETGIPIEIYAFSKSTEWAAYEGLVADIFDHLISIIATFDLKPFQNPSGGDIEQFLEGCIDRRR